MKQPVRITITGAAGNLGYAMAFRIAAGDMLGKDQPIILHLLEITPALTALEGVVMELKDCAFPLLKGVIATDDLTIAFKDTNYALLAGARPRGPGMERKDLLEANGAIFGPQGQALDQYADRNVRVLVVGNPANTNALIVMKNAPSLNYNQFTAMTRLDHNRAQALLAEQTKTHVNDIKKVTIWGNHSSTQYPDLSQTTIKGASALAMVDRKWYEEQYITDVQQRGAAIIKARGVSSAASGASAAIDHMRSWVLGTEAGNWVSMGVPADGSYGIKEGVIFSYPCICVDGHYKIVKGLTIDSFSQAKLDITEKELREEAEAVKTLLGS